MTTINYPHKFEVGDIVFTSIGTELFRQIASASQCWSNHVGMIVGHDGDDYLIAESRVPLSTTTTLSRFISRSSDKRYSVRRLRQSLTQEQKKALVAQVPSRLNKFYHTGFNYDSSRQFCSKFVFDIYQSALSIQIGEIETFEALLTKNPNAKLNFWKLWFIGHIPWERTTVTPASLWHHPELSLVYRSHQDIH
ncbi:YebB family permuted papain-like enzyme [Providencia rettgeri]